VRPVSEQAGGRVTCCLSLTRGHAFGRKRDSSVRAYELLGLDDRRKLEVGAAAAGNSRAALAAYSDGIVEVLLNAKSVLRRGAPILIVVNDRRELYPEILERAGLRLEERLRRHVNRRTGRRAGEYFEDVLIAR
jgi:hypothetical protein